MSQHMGGGHSEVLNKRDAVVRHRANARRCRRWGRSAGAAIVDGDDAVARGKIGDDRLPAQRVGSETRNEKKRCAIAAAFVIEIDVAACEHCHRTLPPIIDREA
jgi:hypothetical protein